MAPRRRRPAPLPVKADKAVLAEHNKRALFCVLQEAVLFMRFITSVLAGIHENLFLWSRQVCALVLFVC